MDGVHGADQNPDLNHVTRLPIVGRGSEARGDDHAVAIFVQDKAVQSAPPFVTVNRTLRPVVSFGPDA